MTLNSKLVVACAMSALPGCYYLFPTQLPPSHKGELVIPGEQLELKTRNVKTFSGSCSNSDIEAGKCELRDGKLKRWYMQTHARVDYGGKHLTYAEVRELADPEYPQRIATMKSLDRACTISLVPSALAIASVAVGVFAPLLEADKLSDNQKTYFYIGGGVAGAVFGALSYPLGGYACVKSNHAAKADYDWTRDDWEGDGADLQKLVDDFNTRIRGGAAHSPDATPESTGDPTAEPQPKHEGHRSEPIPPADQPPPEAAPIVSPARDALVATGKFPSFVAAIDNAKAWDRFEAKAFTIFAPTEDAFVALPEKDRTYLLTTHSGMVAVVWGNHVVHRKLTRAQISKEVRLGTHGSQREPITKKGKRLLIDGAEIGQPIDTPDGVIYPIDKVLQ